MPRDIPGCHLAYRTPRRRCYNPPPKFLVRYQFVIRARSRNEPKPARDMEVADAGSILNSL